LQAKDTADAVWTRSNGNIYSKDAPLRGRREGGARAAIITAADVRGMRDGLATRPLVT